MTYRFPLTIFIATVCSALMLTPAVGKDYGKLPLEQLQRLASRGDAGAQVELATALEHGEGVEKDPGQAIGWYCRAARQGSAAAQRSLGWIYANGSGVPKDEELAAYWLARAAKSGDDYAARLLSFISDDAPKTHSGGCRHVASPTWLKQRCSKAACRETVELVQSLSIEYGLDANLVLAVIAAESNFNPRAKSSQGAIGLMQLIPATAKRFGVQDIWDKEQNIRGGMAYLRWLLAYFEGDLTRVLAGYNAGERAVVNYAGVPPYRETRAYVKKILQGYGKSAHLFDKRWLNHSGDKARSMAQNTGSHASDSDGA